MTDTPLAAHRTDAGTTASGLPPVLLLHGFAASAEADYLATGWPESFAGRTVIALDLPGHGDSPALGSAEEARTSRVLARIADAVHAAVGAGPVDVVGYSLGARLAWDLPTAAPGLVRRLVLGGLSPVEPFAAVDLVALRRAAGLGAAHTDATDTDATDTDATDTDATDTPVDPLTGMMAGMIGAPGLDTASLAALIAGLASEPFEPRAAAPAVPTLLAAGADDPMSQGVDDLATLLPNGRLERVPGDHRGALDSAEFRAQAVAFLGD